jgi:glycosyltransferase involved in cell wall biosynthesis
MYRGQHLAQDSRGVLIESILVSIIIPTFNGAQRIPNCLDALLQQKTQRPLEIVVVDDGSTDDTADTVRRYSSVRLCAQSNAGPAAARNRGAAEAHGSIILFTDDDCVPMPDWVEAMSAPFSDPEVVGVKGTYRTQQTSLTARFVQIEYEDRYRLMSRFPCIDFVDTYSAAFRRDRFLEIDGYDASFPLACAEDVELSYRMSMRGWKMKFAPQAVVYHTHPDTISRYLKKKYKFAFWRVLAVRKNPRKAVKDTHTPQLMKLQILFVPALLLALAGDVWFRRSPPFSSLVLGAFLISVLPFAYRAFIKDAGVGMLSPIFLMARSCAQLLGVIGGLLYSRHTPPRVTPDDVRFENLKEYRR